MTRGLPILGGLLLSVFSPVAFALPAWVQNSNQLDYVIVGAGPAGLVVAEYLSRDPNKNVVVLEAGTNQDTNVNVTTPAFFINTAPFAWPYLVQPDPNLNGATPDLEQGKLLGGGSGVNAMFYCRGSASVFDQWATQSGNSGLKWSSIIDAFKATSHYTTDPKEMYQQALNLTAFGNGPLEVTKQRERFAFDIPFATKLQSYLGVPMIDFVSGGGIGVSLGLETIRAGNRTRSYSYNSFGYIANNRKNFAIVSQAWVSKIGFSGKTANSITFNLTQANTMVTLPVKEIIVAAGAINSPQLLMLSGVGPAAQLQALGIPVVQDSPGVGQNLLDHHLALVEYAVTNQEETFFQYTFNSTDTAIETSRYKADGSGVFGTNLGGVFGMARLPNSVFNNTGSSFYPNLPADRPHAVYEYTNIGTIPNSPNISLITGWTGVVQPESSGNVKLKSADYRVAPLINSNFYGTASEKALILYAYKQLRSIFNSADLKQYIIREVYPGPNVTSDADIMKAIQGASSSWHHPVGTTAAGTVLDANWRVKGVSGLRVVGSPAAPYINTCPIQSAIYAIAYRAAQDIAAADGVNVGSYH